MTIDLFTHITDLLIKIGSWLPAIIVLGFLIFIHELGHFLAARKVKARVDIFSLGFGPRLVGFKRGETDYRISLIPLGGYVKMAGEEPIQNAQMPTSTVKPTETDTRQSPNPDEITSKSIPERFLVYISGVLMNALVAIILVAGLAYTGILEDVSLLREPRVGYVVPGSPADTIGIKKNDLIRSVNGKDIENWQTALESIMIHSERSIALKVRRDDSILDFTLPPGNSDEFVLNGIDFPRKIIVGGVNAQSPASEAGFQMGDEISAVNGSPISTIQEMQYLVNESAGDALMFTVHRNSEILEKSVTPQLNTELNRYLIGITFSDDRVLKKYPFLESVKLGFVKNYEMGRSMFQFLGMLVTGQLSVKNLGGPIMIGVMAKNAADSGLRSLAQLTALISLNLAILNVLPIPLLDGGLILFLLIEAIRRRPLSDNVMIVLNYVFFFALIGLALLLSYNDILRLLKF